MLICGRQNLLMTKDFIVTIEIEAGNARMDAVSSCTSWMCAVCIEHAVPLSSTLPGMSCSPRSLGGYRRSVVWSNSQVAWFGDF